MGGFEASRAPWDLSQGWDPAKRMDRLVWQRGTQRGTDAERLAEACSRTAVPFPTEGQRSR